MYILLSVCTYACLNVKHQKPSKAYSVPLCWPTALASVSLPPGPTPSTWGAPSPSSPCRVSAPTSTCVCATSTAKERASESREKWGVCPFGQTELGHSNRLEGRARSPQTRVCTLQPIILTSYFSQTQSLHLCASGSLYFLSVHFCCCCRCCCSFLILVSQ